MRIWSILLIKSDLKWCIHLSRSLFLYLRILMNFLCIYLGEERGGTLMHVYIWGHIVSLTIRQDLPLLLRYARACSSYECFILRAMRLSNKLLGQGYVKERLKSSLRKFNGRYGDLTKQYEVPLSRMLHDILDDDHIQ